MSKRFRFCVSFSGLTVRFDLPSPVSLSGCYRALLCADTASPDAEYRIVLLNEPLPLDAPPVHREDHTLIYHTDKGWLRVYSALTAADGCQVACLFCPDGRHTLYLPTSQWDVFAKHWSNSDLLAGEKLLIRHDAFLLHSSLVLVNGKAVLFSGPSGAGKSTQAGLWHEYFGAEILNGDRTVVMKRADGFYGGGSIWSGTSGIYRPDQAPIAGIFLVNKSTENSVQPLGFEAFVPLLTQTLVNSWDRGFMETLTGLFSGLLSQIPVYQLNCLPNRDAAELAYNTLFQEAQAE